MIIHIKYLAVIWYTGHGEKNTGNWCFKDGIITFQDIFGLYMDRFVGKRLVLHCDCSYSGNWIKDCVKKLDALGIPSCGHHTRKQGILLGLCSSCGADENATALCYITESHKISDKLKNSMVTFYNKRLSSGQTTKWIGFGRIRCSRQPATETCEIDSTCTWEDRILKSHLVYLVRSKDRGRNTWCYVLVDEDKEEVYKTKIRSGRIDVSNYGTVLYSGWGQDPPKDIMYNIYLRFNLYIDPGY